MIIKQYRPVGLCITTGVLCNQLRYIRLHKHARLYKVSRQRFTPCRLTSKTEPSGAYY